MLQNSLLKLCSFFYSLLFLPFQQKTQFREALAHTMSTASSPAAISWEVNLNSYQPKPPLQLFLLQSLILMDLQEPPSDTSMPRSRALTHHACPSVQLQGQNHRLAPGCSRLQVIPGKIATINYQKCRQRQANCERTVGKGWQVPFWALLGSLVEEQEGQVSAQGAGQSR